MTTAVAIKLAAVLMTAAFGNSVQLGIPMATALFGEPGTTAAIVASRWLRDDPFVVSMRHLCALASHAAVRKVTR